MAAQDDDRQMDAIYDPGDAWGKRGEQVRFATPGGGRQDMPRSSPLAYKK